jgi:hypothetical protein
VYFEDYAKYLNRRPFIDYALNHFQQHKDNCDRRHQQRKDDCSQCVNDERLVFQLSEQLNNNPASLLLRAGLILIYARTSLQKRKARPPNTPGITTPLP